MAPKKMKKNYRNMDEAKISNFIYAQCIRIGNNAIFDDIHS